MIEVTLPRLATWIGVVPDWIRRLLAGPMTRVRIGLDDAAVIGPRRYGRPISVELDPELVLTTWLALPEVARREVRHAAILRIEAETPFRETEVLAKVTSDGAQGDAERRYRIDLAPWQPIESGLQRLRLKSGAVQAIEAVRPGAGDKVRFPVRSRRAGILRLLVMVLPLGIALAGMFVVGLRQFDQQQRLADGLEAEAASEMALLKSEQAEFETREASIAGRKALETMLSQTPSAFLLLNELKRGVASGVDIEKIEIADGVVTLSVKAIDALGAIREMNTRPGWEVAAVGSIAADPATAREIATIGVKLSR